ncbi:hypothetical protein SAMN05444372_107145 [Flavobacterium micromati]|uniref:Yip1 domain-containing protein n=1 Tax=Flavobacterium micromati TaxID=229205 RepID=A0A1M5KZA5_9FLAO|nr:YIP1 family protein [Flavobacterium micromati]SHG58010.1 hypothetical protein SAMN05444372_107145 [Flavobacterium micromati]
MNWQTIFNPFSKFSEKQLFVFGFLVFWINSFVCFFTKTRMDSIFHFTPNENLSFSTAILLCVISTVSAIIFIFLMALLFNKKTRFIDIVNTVLICQAPNFLVLLYIKYSGMDTLARKLQTNIGTAPSIEVSAPSVILLVACILLLLTIIVYGFVLLYNGFKTATNLKKWQHTVLLVISLFTFLIFHQVYIHYLDL